MHSKSIALLLLISLLLLPACEKDENNMPLQFDELHDILILPDGSTLIAGIYGNNVRLIRTTSSYMPLWQQQNYEWGINLKEINLGSSGYIANITGLFINDQGNFVCIVDIIAGGCVIYSNTIISEISPEGNEVKSLQFEGGGPVPYLVVKCPDGGFLLKGDNKFIKLNSGLEKVWEKDVDEGLHNIFALRVSNNNQFVSTGSTDHFYLNMRLWDKDMNNIRTSVFANPSGFGEEMGFDVTQFNDSGYLIAGRSRNLTGNFNFDAYLIRTDATGDTVWTKRFGDDTDQYFTNIIYSDNEMIVVKGHHGERGEPDERNLFFKISPDGEFIDTSYWNISTSFYQKSGDQFVKAMLSDAGVLNLEQIDIDEIFNQ